ncbi:hypothetical protein VE03_10695, partial [Pseudogymnoascus sp. 23342-1-I1]
MASEATEGQVAHLLQKKHRNTLNIFENVPPMHFCETFAINYGIVVIDPNTRWILITQRNASFPANSIKGEYTEYALPEGRKNVDEEPGATAVREILSKTGLQCKLTCHSLPTLATYSANKSEEQQNKLNKEPLAVTQRTRNGFLEITLWYLAEADSKTLDTLDTEDFVWAKEEQVLDALEFQDHQEIARK